MEFQDLKQDQLTVSQYEAKFTQLSRYAEKLVSEEEDRAKRFVRGLRPEIRSKLIPFQLQIYGQAVEKALEIERDMQESLEARTRELPFMKRPRYAHGSQSRSRPPTRRALRRIGLGDSDRSRAIRAKRHIESSKNSEKIRTNLKKI